MEKKRKSKLKLEPETQVWKEQRGTSWYRLQTTDKAVKRRFARRERWSLIGEGLNCNLWIFRGQMDPKNAKRFITNLRKKGEVLEV